VLTEETRSCPAAEQGDPGCKELADLAIGDLTLALADRKSQDRFLREHGVTDEIFEQALRAGLSWAISSVGSSRSNRLTACRA
jgi:hypothetical protein